MRKKTPNQPTKKKKKKTKKVKVDPLLALAEKGKTKGLAAKEITLEEEIFRMEISGKEEQTLYKVFKLFTYDEKENIHKQFFDEFDVARILKKLGVTMTTPEIKNMIWEVDEDLNDQIDKYEFTLMYKRCVFDKSGLEPRSLFNLVQFLMYLVYNDKQQGAITSLKSFPNTITVENSLELLYRRISDPQLGIDPCLRRKKLDEEIRAIFGEKDKTSEGKDIEITFEQYLQKVNKRALEERTKRKEAKRKLNQIKEQHMM